MAHRGIVLPEREQMTKALLEVSRLPALVQHLYPLLCERLAGKRFNSVGVMTQLNRTLVELKEELENVDVSAQIYPALLRAIIPPTESDVRQEALAAWDELQRNRPKR